MEKEHEIVSRVCAAKRLLLAIIRCNVGTCTTKSYIFQNEVMVSIGRHIVAEYYDYLGKNIKSVARDLAAIIHVNTG